MYVLLCAHVCVFFLTETLSFILLQQRVVHFLQIVPSEYYYVLLYVDRKHHYHSSHVIVHMYVCTCIYMCASYKGSNRGKVCITLVIATVSKCGDTFAVTPKSSLQHFKFYTPW